MGCPTVRVYRCLAIPTSEAWGQPTFLTPKFKTLRLGVTENWIKSGMRNKNLIKKWFSIAKIGYTRPSEDIKKTYVDIPSMMFAGFAFGFLFDGVLTGTIGTLIEAFDGYKEWWQSLTASLGLIIISAGICGIGFLYWWLVPRKIGVLYPALTGFGCLFAFLSFLSALVIGIMFYSSITIN